MPLSQSLFGEGQGGQAVGQGGHDVQNADGTWSWVPTTGNGPLLGSDLTNTLTAGDTPGVNAGIYQNAINLAQAQAGNYQGMGNSALNVAAPTLNNPTAAAARAQMDALQGQYTTANAGMQNTLAGGGINAGGAVQAQGMQQNVAAQMAAAHSGRGGLGGYSLGGALGAQGAGVAAGQGLAAQSAAARQGQIQSAQQGLAGNLAAQGGLALSQQQLNQQSAIQQAQLQEAQNAQNLQYAQGLYGASQTQQGAAAQALQQYYGANAGTMAASTNQQNVSNKQTEADLSMGLAAAGAVASLA